MINMYNYKYVKVPPPTSYRLARSGLFVLSTTPLGFLAYLQTSGGSIRLGTVLVLVLIMFTLGWSLPLAVIKKDKIQAIRFVTTIEFNTLDTVYMYKNKWCTNIGNGVPTTLWPNWPGMVKSVQCMQQQVGVNP